MDLTFLEPTLTAGGPVATVCADVTHKTESADAELELRVRAVAAELERQGAPEAAVAAVRERLLEGNDDPDAGLLHGRAVVAGGDGTVLLDAALVDAPLREVVEWSPLPDLMPILRQLPGRVPHIVAVCDRVGADIEVAGTPGQDRQESVDGETEHIRKVRGGGWAHLRYQHNAEDVWKQNAQQVAEELDRLVRQVGPAFVLVAGDERARQVLVDHLTPAVSELVVTMSEGGRAAGADRDVVAQRAAALVAEHEARETADVLERLEARLGSADGPGAVAGLGGVVDALRKAQVETLLLADEPGDAEVLIADDPMLLGLDRSAMAAMNVEDAARPAPAERALVRAAVATRAGVVVVPAAALPENVRVAALLRYVDPSTP